MISFAQFLKESSPFDLQKFKTDCAPYLQHLKGTSGRHMLYHGTKSRLPDWDIVKWRERDAPRDTPRPAHDALNDYFKRRLGAPIRNWLFVTGLANEAKMYAGDAAGSQTTVIFPVGQFQWAQGRNENNYDMTGWFDRTVIDLKRTAPSLSFDERRTAAVNYMIKKMDGDRWVFNEDLVDCIKHENEIMLKCDRFYQFTSFGDTFESAELKSFLSAL